MIALTTDVELAFFAVGFFATTFRPIELDRIWFFGEVPVVTVF